MPHHIPCEREGEEFPLAMHALRCEAGQRVREEETAEREGGRTPAADKSVPRRAQPVPSSTV